jgi:hypothetical protein
MLRGVIGGEELVRSEFGEEAWSISGVLVNVAAFVRSPWVIALLVLAFATGFWIVAHRTSS